MTKKFNKRGHAIFSAEILLLLVLFFGCGENIDTVDDNNGNTITEPHLTAITISPADAVISDDADQQYTAIGRYSDNAEKDITTNVTWNSADAAVATITSAGLAKAAIPSKSGTVDISAALEGFTGRVSLTVIDLSAPESIIITPACSVISGSKEQQFTVIGGYSNSFEKDITSRVTWSSTDASVATINASGLAVSSPTTTGAVEIIASLGEAESRAELTVTDTELPQSISITPEDPSIPYGTSVQFKAEGILSDGSKQDMTSMVKWLSSDATVTIGPDGLAKSTVKGLTTTTISAAFACITGKSTLTADDVNLMSISVTPAYACINLYWSRQFTATGTFSGNFTWDITNDVDWNSSDVLVATIDITGLATSNGRLGQTTIRASSVFPLLSASAETLLYGCVE